MENNLYDNTPTTLAEFYRNNYCDPTEFTEAFLSSQNVAQIQYLLTNKLKQVVNNPTLPLVQLTDNLLSILLEMATTYRLAFVNLDTISYANLTFVDQVMPSIETRYNETAFWRRWCDQGIPDPNNIPLPLAPETTDFTAEIDSYTLSNPWGQPRPMW